MTKADELRALADRPSLYQIGNQLFVDFRAFLTTAGVDPSKCKLTITLPNRSDQKALVKRLKQDAPPIGNHGGISAAQAGNNAGYWQGVEYEIVPQAAMMETSDES